MDILYESKCSICGGNHTLHFAELPEEIKKQAEKIARQLYDQQLVSGEIEPSMIKLVAEHLRQAMIEGFGKDFPKVNYDTPDYKMLSSLELNVYHFSAAENYQMIVSMSAALHDYNGSLRSWVDFRNEATKITGVYLDRNLKTEYGTAIASSQMASKWVDFEKNKATANWLRYDTMHDSRVRPSHKLLDGIIKKVDDVFWTRYYPPNDFNCRCDVTQLLHGAETPSDSIHYPDDIPPMFQTNMAKDGIVFPKEHPYYIGMPENIYKKAEALRNSQYSPAYNSKKTNATVQISSMAQPDELKYNYQNSVKLADNGESVKIRPHVEAKKIKNPELELYNGTQLGDFKEPKPKGNFKNSYEHQIINTSKQQAQIPVLVLNKINYNPSELARALNNDKMWDRTKGITEVWLLFEKKLTKITREEIKLKTFYSKLPK